MKLPKKTISVAALLVGSWWGTKKLGDMTGIHLFTWTAHGIQHTAQGVKLMWNNKGAFSHPIDSLEKAEKKGTREWGLDAMPQLLYRIKEAKTHPGMYDLNDPALKALGIGNLGEKMPAKEEVTLEHYRNYHLVLNAKLKELGINPADVLIKPDPSSVRLLYMKEKGQIKDAHGKLMVDDGGKPVMGQTGVRVFYLTGGDSAVQLADGVEIRRAGTRMSTTYGIAVAEAKEAKEIGSQVGTIIGTRTTKGDLKVNKEGAQLISDISFAQRGDNPRRMDSPYFTVERQELVDFLAGKHGNMFVLELKHRVESPSGDPRLDGHILRDGAYGLKLISRNADSRLLQDAAQVNAPQQELRASNNETRRQTNAASNLRIKSQYHRNHGRAA
jgi:hypothetical protein